MKSIPDCCNPRVLSMRLRSKDREEITVGLGCEAFMDEAGLFA